MEMIYFLARYTPFWSIPGLMISGEFAYLFWIRKKKKIMLTCACLAAFCGTCTVMYFIAGGPEKSVKALIELISYYRD